MSLESQITALATRVANEIKGIKTILNGSTNLATPGSLVTRDALYGGTDLTYVNLAFDPNAYNQAAHKGYVDLRGLDRPGGYQASPAAVGTRRAAFSWGHGGDATFTDRNIAFQRMPILLPVNTTRWRLRVSNKNPAGTLTGAGAITYGNVYIADAFRNFQTGEPNGWSGAWSLAHGGSGSLAAGVDWVTGWVTDPNMQIKRDIMRHVQIQWNKASGSTVYTSPGICFQSTNMSDVTATAPTMTAPSTTAFAITLEYEFVGSNRVIGVIGDSITEGTGARYAFSTWHQQLSMRYKMPVCSSAQIGASAGSALVNNYGATALTQPRWQRLRDAGCNIDVGIIFLGTNDTAFGGNLANAQDGYLATARRMRSEWGVRDVYATTIPPQNATSTRETLRTTINTWMRQGYTQEFNVFDVQPAMEAAVNSANLRAGYEGYTPTADYTHFGPAGAMAFASAINLNAM